MIRKAFTMPVHPDKHEEYEKRHSPIWPELAQLLKDHGVSNYSIFLHAESSRLFGYLEIADEETWLKLRETEILKKWWASMKEIMPTHADNRPLSEPLKLVFHMD